MLKEEKESPFKSQTAETCGVIMPISDIDGYPLGHWSEVKQIIFDVIRECGFTPNIVSDSSEVGLIHNRIVSNIVANPIVVCDVSAKNPNVMFELGLRLAFDKPVIIIKDDLTNYSFDTSSIEHLNYPMNLRHGLIEQFKIDLSHKIRSTYEAAKNPTYSPFLKHFIEYKPKIREKELPLQQYIEKQFSILNSRITLLSQQSVRKVHRPSDAFENARNGLETTVRKMFKEWLSTATVPITSGHADVFDFIHKNFMNITLREKGLEGIVIEGIVDRLIKEYLHSAKAGFGGSIAEA